MDLRLFFSVLQRFRVLVTIGLVVACACAFFSFVKVGPKGLQYRQQEKWMSTARVLVTSTNQDPVQLAITYASYATGDEVAKAAFLKHRVVGTLQADFGYSNRISTALPTVAVAAISTTPEKSAVLANDGITALRQFVAQQDAASGLPPAKRAQLQPLNRAVPATAQVASGRSKLPPVVVFVLVVAATVGLAFVLENLRPRVQVVPAALSEHRTSVEATHVRQQA